jgi:hypothetical protein
MRMARHEQQPCPEIVCFYGILTATGRLKASVAENQAFDFARWFWWVGPYFQPLARASIEWWLWKSSATATGH